MGGTNLLHFLLSSRGIKNLLCRAYRLVQRFGFSPNKMESALTQWLKISRKFNVRASFPVTAIVVKRYPGPIKRLQDRGLEFALHGYTHIDYSSLSMEEQLAHFADAIRIFKVNAISFDGFRAPYTRWNKATMEAIQKLKINWDSSKTVLWDISNKIQNPKSKIQIKKVLTLYNPYSASNSTVLPELNNGCVEIPLCLPDDEMLVDRLGLTQEKIREVWEHILALSYTRGELFTLQLHPERLPLCKDALESVLRKAKKYNPKIWLARLSEIAEWWNERAKFNAKVEKIEDGSYKILFDCSPRATILLKNIDVQGIEPWDGSYQRLTGEMHSVRDRRSHGVYEIVVKSKVAPVIDVGNNCSPKTISFLKSEGYIVKGNHDRHLPIVSGLKTLLPQVEETGFNKFEILDRIEKSGVPIIRFWRWPYGTKSCLSITGDIDALTLFDFLMRAVGK